MKKMFNQMNIPRIFTTLTLLLVFCLPLEAASIRIGLVLPELSNAAINDIAIGAKKRAKEIGNIEILVTGTYSGEEQAKAVENYIAAGVDLIAYDSIDAAAVGPAIVKANKANIPVIGVISAASSGEMITFITPDFCENGRLIGNWMSKTLGKNGIVFPTGTAMGVFDIGMYKKNKKLEFYEIKPKIPKPRALLKPEQKKWALDWMKLISTKLIYYDERNFVFYHSKPITLTKTNIEQYSQPFNQKKVEEIQKISCTKLFSDKRAERYCKKELTGHSVKIIRKIGKLRR